METHIERERLIPDREIESEMLLQQELNAR